MTKDSHAESKQNLARDDTPFFSWNKKLASVVLPLAITESYNA